LVSGVILSEGSIIGADAVSTEVFTAVFATVSCAFSIYLARTVISGKRAGNAG
jgi:hypothetical protein